MVLCRDTAAEPQFLQSLIRPLFAILKHSQDTETNEKTDLNLNKNDANQSMNEKNANFKNEQKQPFSAQNMKFLRRALGTGLHRKIVAGDIFSSWNELAQTRGDPFFVWDERRFHALKKFAETGELSGKSAQSPDVENGAEMSDEPDEVDGPVVCCVYLGALTEEQLDARFFENVVAEGFLAALVNRFVVESLRRGYDAGRKAVREVERVILMVLRMCAKLRGSGDIDVFCLF